MSEAERRELVIVGGGPAGLEAAIAAGRHGVDTVLLDERDALGGQIYRQRPADFAPSNDRDSTEGRRLIAKTAASGTEVRLETTVWGAWGKELATVSPGTLSRRLRAQQLILATGAYDRPVPFPGWTLPGVMTAGGAHALVKSQGVIPGRRLLVAGSGPLVLSFAAQLHREGANVIAVAEAAPRPSLSALVGMAEASIWNLDSLFTGARHVTYLLRKGVEFLYSHVVSRADGHDQVGRVILAKVDRSGRPTSGSERAFEIDTLCVGYGLVPSTELSRLCGCEHTYDRDRASFVPARDSFMRTSQPGILAAGDGAGVAGSAVARLEGKIAGLTAALAVGRAPEAAVEADIARAQAQLRKLHRMRLAMTRVYPLGPWLYELANAETIVCRCEEVTQQEVVAEIALGHRDLASLKALTRAGMGPCQGRNCEEHLAWLLAQGTDRSRADVGQLRVRVPVKPVEIGRLAEEVNQPDPTSREWARDLVGLE
jgi:NADPH-dependent 2,4-dienoyl-CoA reductase/sulfur reductase-like enzyme